MDRANKEDWASSVLLFISALMVLIQLWLNLVMAGIAASLDFPRLMLNIALLIFGPVALAVGAMRSIRRLKLRLAALIVGSVLTVCELSYSVIDLNRPEPPLVAKAPSLVPSAILLIMAAGVLIASYRKLRQLTRPAGD